MLKLWQEALRFLSCSSICPSPMSVFSNVMIQKASRQICFEFGWKGKLIRF